MENIMKAVNRDQACELVARFLTTTNWGALDGGMLQEKVIQLSSEELGRRFTRFMANGCQFVIKGPSALLIDRAAPFDPAKFIGAGWSIVGEDQAALGLTTVDFSAVRFESGLKEGEQAITGEEKLKRLKVLSGIRLDAKVGQALYEEKGQTTLRWLYDTFGIAWLELSGTVLRGPAAFRCFLYLYRFDGGSWYWNFHWLGSFRGAKDVSPVSASNA